jgi:tRNA isopentenyl-2-thiomethyl-A-37 hydroxylase MiaE
MAKPEDVNNSPETSLVESEVFENKIRKLQEFLEKLSQLAKVEKQDFLSDLEILRARNIFYRCRFPPGPRSLRSKIQRDFQEDQFDIIYKILLTCLGKGKSTRHKNYF